METTDTAVLDARNLLHSIVDLWDRQRYSGDLKDRAEEFLSFLDGAWRDLAPPSCQTFVHKASHCGRRSRPPMLADTEAACSRRPERCSAQSTKLPRRRREYLGHPR